MRNVSVTQEKNLAWKFHHNKKILLANFLIHFVKITSKWFDWLDVKQCFSHKYKFYSREWFSTVRKIQRRILLVPHKLQVLFSSFTDQKLSRQSPQASFRAQLRPNTEQRHGHHYVVRRFSFFVFYFWRSILCVYISFPMLLSETTENIYSSIFIMIFFSRGCFSLILRQDGKQMPDCENSLFPSDDWWDKGRQGWRRWNHNRSQLNSITLERVIISSVCSHRLRFRRKFFGFLGAENPYQV